MTLRDKLKRPKRPVRKNLTGCKGCRDKMLKAMQEKARADSDHQ